VPGVVLAEERLELADFCGEAVGKGDEVGVALFDVDAVRRDGEEELGLGVRVDEASKAISASSSRNGWRGSSGTRHCSSGGMAEKLPITDVSD